jgi:hypothetical protein
MAQTKDTQGWPPESALDAGDADEADASGRYDAGRGLRWYVCDKCGFPFPSNELDIHPVTGLRLCRVGPNDYDEYPDSDPRLQGNYHSRLYPDEVTV